MGFVLTVTFGLVVWIVFWATGHSGLDAFMIALAITIVGVSVRILSRYVPGRRD